MCPFASLGLCLVLNWIFPLRMTENTENLQKYEELFAHRFTSEDREFQEYVSRPADPPPIVEDWRARGGGNQRGRDNG